MKTTFITIEISPDANDETHLPTLATWDANTGKWTIGPTYPRYLNMLSEISKVVTKYEGGD